MDYKKRIADDELEFRLECSGAVLIEGPKWCGKTTTGKQHAKSIIQLQDPDKRENYRNIVETMPSILLRGDNPRLIDEWQEAPVLWDAVRLSIDNRNELGLYILTGSNSIRTEEIKHSGTGRISRMQMETMSLYESEESSGEISLSYLFNNPQSEIFGESKISSLDELIFVSSRGGWPGFLTRKTDGAKLQIAKDYISSIAEIDISTIDGRKRNPALARLILKSYARNISTLAKNESILSDIKSFGESASISTLSSYSDALEKLFILKNMEAWSPLIRSASAIKSGRKIGFTDPSIAVAAMGTTPDELLNDLNTFGFIFESLCLRDLRVYSAKNGGRISFYRDRYGLEADCVLHLSDGRYALVEFKLGRKQIEEGASHLLKIKSLITEHNEKNPNQKMREPDLLIVITGLGMGIRMHNGVYVIPIGCLKD